MPEQTQLLLLEEPAADTKRSHRQPSRGGPTRPAAPPPDTPEPRRTPAPDTADTSDAWAALVGQPSASAHLAASAAHPTHAYLLVGPRGSGKLTAARVFAGEVLAAADPHDAQRHRDLAARNEHPDIFTVAPEGTQLTLRTEAAALKTEAAKTPVGGTRKVLIADRFHTATPSAAAALLKPIEEPAPSTIWVLLSERIPQTHATIASRCVQVNFKTLTDQEIASALANENLADGAEALSVAAASGGNLRRARLLAADEQVAARRRAWQTIPERLDGTGNTVFVLVEEIRSLISDAAAPLAAQHKNELKAHTEHEKMLDARRSSAEHIKARHRREQRQLRTDELVSGLGVLAARYREIIVKTHDRQAIAAIGRLRDASAALKRNPNEALLLQSLLLHLPSLNTDITPAVTDIPF